MARSARSFWREFRDAAPGERFRNRYRRRAEQRARGETQLSRPLIIVLALLSCLVAIPLMFTPGPAIIFWGLAGFLISGESAWLARTLDWGELRCREWWRERRRRRERNNRPPPQIDPPKG